MALSFIRSEAVSLKASTEFSERWLQERIADDPTILGLGEVELVAVEKSLPRAGRLDLLLHDEQLNRRYEVELMLGATDPSHIVRCIEYWDVERRRYPAYDHVAVLVAEDITARFLNVMALLAGSIPLIAIQMNAIKVEDKLALHFTRILEQSSLRSDDAYDLGDRPAAVSSEVDRGWWERRSNARLLAVCEELQRMVSEIGGEPFRMRFRKRVIDLVAQKDGGRRVWCQPGKAIVHIGAYVLPIEKWITRFEEAGIPATPRRGNRAVRATVTPEEFNAHESLFREFLAEADAGV